MILHWFHYFVVFFFQNDSRKDGKSKGSNAVRKYHFFGLRIVVFLWIFFLSTTTTASMIPDPTSNSRKQYISKNQYLMIFHLFVGFQAAPVGPKNLPPRRP